MSRGTYAELLPVLRERYGRRGRGLCGTKPGSLLRTQIPIHNEAWDVSQPGWLEADTVAHCGSSLAGELPAPSGAALRAKAPPFGCLAPLGSSGA